MTSLEKILSKIPVPAELTSAEWNRVKAQIRDRALISSQVMSARILSEIKSQLAAAVEGEKSDSEIRRDLREILSKLGYNSGPNRGTIKDLMTKARLDVIIDTNRRQARGFAQHMEATTNGALRAFPAYELVRVYERRQPRNWIQRWTAAGGRLYGGNRMIALKTDPIWTRISVFGTPFPPFDWGSGMGVEDVARSECAALGVIDADTPEQKSPEYDFNEGLAYSVPFGEGSPELEHILKAFGGRIEFRDGVIRWKGSNA